MNAFESFEHVVEAYLLALQRGERDALSSLVSRYPAYEHRLTAYALLNAAVPDEPDAGTLAQADAALTPAVRAGVLAAVFGRPATIEPLPGIIAQGERLGLKASAVAAAVDLPVDVLVQLDRRLIRAGSVPRRLLGRLAAALQTSAESLQQYLAGGPSARVAAFNYAERAPEAGAQRGFAEALADSPLATAAQRAAWAAAPGDEDAPS